MNERIEQVQAGRTDQSHAIDEVARHEAQIGRKLLQNLSSVAQAPTLTFKNAQLRCPHFRLHGCNNGI